MDDRKMDDRKMDDGKVNRGYAAGQRWPAVGAFILWLVMLAGPVSPFIPAASGQDLFGDLWTGIEVLIGQSVAQNVMEEYGPPVRLAPAYQQWVDAIFHAVAAQAGRNEISYSLQILHSDVVNAFAAPGGYVFVTTGLLAHIGSDRDALANVLGHEIAHVEHRHGMNTIGRQLGVGLLLQLLFSNSDEAWQTVAAVAAQLVSLSWSREQEHESDDLGQRLAAAAGYDPMGMVRFFGVLRQLEGGESPFLEFLSTHPLTSERIERAQQRAETLVAASAARPGTPSPPITRAAAQPPISPTRPAAAAGAPTSGPRVLTRGSVPLPADPGSETPGGAERDAATQFVSVTGFFTVEVPDTWSHTARQEARQTGLLLELADPASRLSLAISRAPVNGGTTPVQTVRAWLAQLQGNRSAFELVEPVWERVLDARNAASFVASWTESGDSWAFYGTAIIVGNYSYTFGFLLPRSELDKHRAVMEQILASWRQSR